MNVYEIPLLPMFPSGDDGPPQRIHTHIPSILELTPEKFSNTGSKPARTFTISYLPLLQAE